MQKRLRDQDKPQISTAGPRPVHARPLLAGLCLLAALTAFAPPAFAAAAHPVTPIYVLGIPVDFILFGVTLLGVAVLHHHTLAVALTGLAAITLYKLVFTGFKFGAGLSGLALHMQHEWVILANLFLLSNWASRFSAPLRAEPRSR